jgi:two-component system response regulator RegX3
MKILLVDDEPSYREAAAIALQREGFDVLVAGDGAEGFRRWHAEHPEAVLVDATIARPDGFELCRRIRKRSETPVLIVAASSDERYILQAFAAGVDDYVVKPVSPRVLGMRIRAVSDRLKRRSRLDRAGPLDVAGVRLDRESNQIGFSDRRVQLTPLEFRILDVLVSNHDRVVGFGRLVDQAWRCGEGTLISLRHHVSHLRRKISELPGHPLQVRVVYGAGYILRINRSPSGEGGRAPFTDGPGVDEPAAPSPVRS